MRTVNVFKVSDIDDVFDDLSAVRFQAQNMVFPGKPVPVTAGDRGYVKFRLGFVRVVPQVDQAILLVHCPGSSRACLGIRRSV